MFEGTLRDEQMKIVDETNRTFENGIYGGIWAVATGFGKSITALYIASQLNLKTIVIVNKEVLLRQWKREIAKFIPNARIGHIQGDTTDVENKDIVIGMLQSLSKRNYPPELFDDIGLMIVDETHNICSRYFSRVLYKIQAKYRLGLSATPHRKDGMETVMIQHLGPIIITINNVSIQPTIKFLDMGDLENDIVQHKDRRGNVNMSRLITDVSKSKIRNQFIVKEVIKLLYEKRRIIVFSDRVLHCKTLNHVVNQTIQKYNLKKDDGTFFTSNVFIGGMKDEDYMASKECDVIFATYGLAKEGFDHPVLDTEIFATPKSDVVQVIGRILRQKNPNEPLIIDLIDKQFSAFKGMYYKRRSYYKSKEYKLLGIGAVNELNFDMESMNIHEISDKCYILDE